MWTLFDLMAIILTMAAFVWNSKNPGSYRNGFNAFVVGLLWMKVVGFLKASDLLVDVSFFSANFSHSFTISDREQRHEYIYPSTFGDPS